MYGEIRYHFGFAINYLLCDQRILFCPVSSYFPSCISVWHQKVSFWKRCH